MVGRKMLECSDPVAQAGVARCACLVGRVAGFSLPRCTPIRLRGIVKRSRVSGPARSTWAMILRGWIQRASLKPSRATLARCVGSLDSTRDGLADRCPSATNCLIIDQRCCRRLFGLVRTKCSRKSYARAPSRRDRRDCDPAILFMAERDAVGPVIGMASVEYGKGNLCGATVFDDLKKQVPCAPGTSAAISRYAQLPPEVGESGCPALGGGDDLAFRDSVANADIHGPTPDFILTLIE
jgi:hypothetical protein